MDQLRPKFLLALRDLMARNLIQEFLTDSGYGEVIYAQNGTDAWSALKRSQAGFIIANWQMREMNGLVLLKVVRSDDKYFDTPFMLVVENITKRQVLEAGLAGVSDILVQPFTVETLRRKVNTLLNVEDDPQRQEVSHVYETGIELMQQGKYDEALAYFQRILTIYEDAEIYYNMGFIHTAQGRYGEAIECFRKATRINHTFARAYQKMAETYKLLGKTLEAERCFKQAAEIYMAKDMDESAEMMLEELLEINPNTINIYNSLGIIYRRRGHHQQAADQYLKALKVNPTDENIYYNLARVYVEMKNLSSAKMVVKKAIALNPGFAEAQNMLRVVELALARGEMDIPAWHDDAMQQQKT